MFKGKLWLVLITACFLGVHVQGKQSCGSLFKSEVLPVLRYAQALDQLNKSHNYFLFKKNILDVLLLETRNQDQIQDQSQNQKLDLFRNRYRARKLRKVLSELQAQDSALHPNIQTDLQTALYKVEKIATNIEKLTFIMDTESIKALPRQDRAIYLQLQHSLLAHGISRFLFTEDIDFTPSQIQILKAKLMAPFKRVYLRWVLAPVMMPKLDGAVLPFELVEKIIWQGYQNSREDLAPYLRTIQGKRSFNIFSVAWNWMFAVMIASTTLHWGYETSVASYEAYKAGEAQAQQTLQLAKKSAQDLASKDLGLEYAQDTLQIAMDLYKEQYGHSPSEMEIDKLKQLILGQKQVYSKK